MPPSYLLGRDIEGERPHVHLLVGVDAGDDEEDAGAAGAAAQKATQAEDDHALVLLNDLQRRERVKCLVILLHEFHFQEIFNGVIIVKAGRETTHTHTVCSISRGSLTPLGGRGGSKKTEKETLPFGRRDK